VTAWSIGAASVTRVEEQIGAASFPPEQFIPGLDRDLLNRHMNWLVPNHYSPDRDGFVTSVHSWLIRTGRHTILLDCCAGNHKERPGYPRFHGLDTPYLARLRAAGAAPEDIDIVLCTHLHADHVGWNTVLRDGRWVPTFPNAKYLFSRIENEHGDPRRNPAADADPQRGRAYRDSVLPVIEAGQAVLLDGAHAIDECVLVEPAPGHTKGHIIVKLADGGARVIQRRCAASSAANLCAASELAVLRISRASPRHPPPLAGALRRGSGPALSCPFRRAPCRRDHARRGGVLASLRRPLDHDRVGVTRDHGLALLI
jgi:glyoxylase-like metal-dependent hydrolase (beta-lactamase superfamily II)